MTERGVVLIPAEAWPTIESILEAPCCLCSHPFRLHHPCAGCLACAEQEDLRFAHAYVVAS